MPIGAVGEIQFAGAGVVKGYLERPELTAEKFVEQDGERFYRTGDMGRIGEDGWLEILGRNDFQIKIRGMRIELGEVEYNLRRAPGVRDAVVVAKPGPGGDKIMVGYVVFGDAAGDPGAAGTDSSAARLAAVRRHMVDHLPDYMVPAAYMELASLPVNHNLKVDRHALHSAEVVHRPAVRRKRMRYEENSHSPSSP
jgi:acyl-CoA synthetase (AMP-forming)/AMP-acid ligase II